MTMLALSVSSIDAMRWQRRVILVAAPSAAEPALAAQRKILGDWRGGYARDVSVVEIAGTAVAGATDTADRLRKTYALPAERFEVILIGKDGGVKLRSAHPFSADILTQTIDAMPMRQAGER